MSERAYESIVRHYEACLEQHGDTHRGVDWPKAEDVDARYGVMSGVVRPGQERASVLDLGCGAAHLLDYLRRVGLSRLDYAGLDLSEKFVALCRDKHPQIPFYCADLLRDRDAIPTFDYVVMNGVFTEKRELSFDTMLDYWKRLLDAVWAKTRVGLAFNVMSKQVDWERDDLFHLPLDVMAGHVVKALSRHFVVRNDYGLYEYTTYVYREPSSWQR